MRRILTLIVCMISLQLWAQNEEIDLEYFAERLFQVQDEEIAYEDIYESLLLFYSNKLNLNKVQPEELASLYLLSPTQLSHFFSYRDQFGDFLSIHELQAIPSFNLETIRLLLPFVSVRETESDGRPLLKRMVEEENNYFLLRYSRRLEKQKGYTAAAPLDTTFIVDENSNITDTLAQAPSRYAGSPDKIYGRFRTSRRNDFSFGFTFEKDNGEAWSRQGFDFYSYHLLVEEKLGFDKVMLGDFQLQVGQGMVYGAGFNAGKGAETVNAIKRNTLGIRPYTSVLEAGFFRGVGLTKSVGNFQITAFYSNVQQDGNIRRDTTFSDFDAFVRSIQSTGLHRTPSERAARNRINERSIGGVLQYKPHRRLSIGISVLNSHYSTPLQRRPTTFNQFEFKGDRNHIISTFGNYTWQNFTFFGEAAQSESGGIGAVGGLVASVSKAIDLAMIFRNYDRDFHSFYGNAFSENARNINETGTYWGLSIRPNGRHRLNLYYDRFQFPWLKFQTEAPSAGNESLIRYSHFPSRNVTLYIQVRQQLRQVTIPEDNLNILVDQIRRNYFFNVDYELKPWLKLKTKVQSSTQHEANIFTRGFVIIQDLNLKWKKLKLNTRLALFETDNFDNAQYVYESDVLYAFSIPAYNGTGIRTYAMIRYNYSKKISLWLRYAQFRFSNQTTVGSGLEEANGNVSSEVKAMLRFKF